MVGVLLVVWWYRTGTAAAFDGRESRRWFTAPRRLVEWGQTATFADVLALLLEHEVPLPAALPLAAAASGNSRLRSGCDRLAAALSGGESLATPSVAASGLPESPGPSYRRDSPCGVSRTSSPGRKGR